MSFDTIKYVKTTKLIVKKLNLNPNNRKANENNIS